MSNDNVVHLHGVDVTEWTAEQTLAKALEEFRDVEHVLVIAMDGGEVAAAHSTTDAPTINWMLDRFKHHLMRAALEES